MPADILVAVPILNRPKRLPAFYESLVASLEDEPVARCRLLLLASMGDREEIRAARRLRGPLEAELEICPWPAMPGDWARKLNRAIAASSEPWILCGADDLAFHPGWASSVLACATEFSPGVVGTNDLHNPRVKRGQHSTHPLLRRSYAERGSIDGGPILHEGYGHQYVDDELVQTARARGEWRFCVDAVVEHLHPFFGGAEIDSTYQRGLSSGERDLRLFQKRRRLWT